MQRKTIYLNPMDVSLYEEEFTIKALSAIGNPLEQLSSLIDFEIFRPLLEGVLVKSNCKRPLHNFIWLSFSSFLSIFLCLPRLFIGISLVHDKKQISGLLSNNYRIFFRKTLEISIFKEKFDRFFYDD